VTEVETMAEKTIAAEKALTTRTDRSPAPAPAEGQPVATRQPERYLVPAVDIYETDEGLTLVADVPGADKDGLDIDVADGLLTIKAACAAVLHEEAAHREFDLLSYWRQFTLSDEVDVERIGAKLQHGVLTLQLPKAAKAKPKKVTVKMG